MPARKLEWKRIKEKGNEGETLLITPLIDIMFLILIFFVMNTSFDRFSPLEINLPESSTATGKVEESLTLTLFHDHTIKLGDSTVLLKDLSSKLHPLVNDYRSIIIAGDELVSYSFLVNVMDEIRLSGFESITLVTESP